MLLEYSRTYNGSMKVNLSQNLSYVSKDGQPSKWRNSDMKS